MHRQAGKSHLVGNIIKWYMNNWKIDDPVIILVGAQKDQMHNLYLYKHIHKTFERFGGYFDSKNSVYYYPRNLQQREEKDLARVYFLEAQGRSKSARGHHAHFIAGDEMADWKEGFLEEVVLPMGIVHNAPGLFTGTPKGPNFFKKNFNHALMEYQKGNPLYYALKWTIQDSVDSGEMSKEEYYRIKSAYTNRKSAWLAEHMLDFDAYIPGKVFADHIEKLKKERKKIGYFPPVIQIPCDSFWDVGVNGTSVWIRQENNYNHFYIKFIQQLENVNFKRFVQDKFLPYIHKNNLKIRYNVFPHDMNFKDFSSASEKTRLELASEILPGKSIPRKAFRKMDEAIDLVKRNFDRCFFDEEGCWEGLECLQLLSLGSDNKINKKPEFVKYSHAGDAFILAENFHGITRTSPSQVMGVDIQNANLSYEDMILQEMTIKRNRRLNAEPKDDFLPGWCK